MKAPSPFRIAALCALILLGGCSDSSTNPDGSGGFGGHDPDLVGTWVCVDYTLDGAHDEFGGLFGWENTFWEFRDDGTMTETDNDPGEELYTEEFIWSTGGASITMTDESGFAETGSYVKQDGTVLFIFASSTHTALITMQRR
jgi:hypothetical protein